MKRTIIALAMLLLFTTAGNTQTPVNTWATVAQLLAKSTVFIETATGKCTGFLIHSAAKGEDNKDVDYVLTAAHCNGPESYADQQPTKIKSKDEGKDLMVLEIENTDKPALRLAKTDPAVGDQIGSFGYGYGLEKPMFRVTHVSQDKIYIPFGGVGGPLIAVDTTFVPGMSGGPVVNANGEVVMLVQRGSDSVGLGVGAETIRDKTGRFWQYK